MLPLTLLVAQKLSSLLTTNNALAQQIASIAESCNVELPLIPATQVVLSSAAPDIGDKDVQLTYPRVCLFSAGVRNTQHEKFRSLSGTVTVIADVWASAALVGDVDTWVNYYAEAVTSILRANIGDWRDGIFFPGNYDVQFQPVKPGGYGFVESARISVTLLVSQV